MIQDTQKLEKARKENFEWFKENFNSIEKKYNKKFYLIKNKEIIANFDDLNSSQLFLYNNNKDHLISLQTKNDLNLNNQNFLANERWVYGK